MQVSSEIADLNAYQLANLADVPSPDGLESDGAQFLTGVLTAVIEHWDYLDDPDDLDADDASHEIADGAPSVYTYEVWKQFLDLAAWQEDVATEVYSDGQSMEDVARLALYQIAERLAMRLFESIEEEMTNHEHEWGPIENARMTGNPHRKCLGCSMISLDLDDEEVSR